MRVDSVNSRASVLRYAKQATTNLCAPSLRAV